jgi:hypothetical protein
MSTQTIPVAAGEQCLEVLGRVFLDAAVRDEANVDPGRHPNVHTTRHLPWISDPALGLSVGVEDGPGNPGKTV